MQTVAVQAYENLGKIGEVMGCAEGRSVAA
jgi:hypothetical protein